MAEEIWLKGRRRTQETKKKWLKTVGRRKMAEETLLKDMWLTIAEDILMVHG